jgi:DNA-binding transcriptional MocR family regulator
MTTSIDAQYDQYLSAGLALDLTRGKPCSDQLDLSCALEDMIAGNFKTVDGTDARNYGGLLGIPEARALGGTLLDVDPKYIMAGGNSSLTLMYQFLVWRLRAWQENDPMQTFKFICVVPGYDRHFTICEHLGIEMISVGFDADGPNMTKIEALVRQDQNIKGIWCVPKHSNPTGHTYSQATVERLANLPNLAGKDFILMWDNAYAAHDLDPRTMPLSNLMARAQAAQTAHQVALFASTSKITFAGAGLAFCGLSEPMLQGFETFLTPQMIGFDKVNQLRHARLLKDSNDIAKHMAAHRVILEPKFQRVQEKLMPLAEADLATWSQPGGGYFVSLDLKAASATQVIALANAAGVKLTPAGATFPYGRDPEDKNIRIAPSFPDMIELDQALDVLVCCIVKASEMDR